MNKVIQGLLFGIALSIGLVGMGSVAYLIGNSDGQARVIYSCNKYGKYYFDGTQELICSAIIEPDSLKPDKPLSKRDKLIKRKLKEGWSKKQIAKETGASIKTIDGLMRE